MGSRKGKQKRTEVPAPAEPVRHLPPPNPPQKRKGFLVAAIVVFGLWLAALVAMALWT